jgi:hypothetical protein
MEMTTKKTLVAAVALATLLAAPALAQIRDRAASNPTSPQAAPHNGQVTDPDAVMSNGRVIGRDPDPWIRNGMLRHHDSERAQPGYLLRTISS